jgi:hypothetical protein
MENKNYEEIIESINNNFLNNLEDFQKYYVYYQKNPENTEFQNQYNQAQFELSNLSSELLKITKNIYTDINDLDVKLHEVSQEINSKKDENEQMIVLTKNLKNTENGSAILINDSKDVYNKQYYDNFKMLGSCVIVSGLLVFLFLGSSTPSALKTNS